MSVFLIYGNPRLSPTYWYTWISEKIAASGLVCAHISLPNPQQPDYEQYKQIFIHQDIQLNEDSIIIAHELGVLVALDWLSIQLKQGKRIKALFVISASNQNLAAKPEYHSFMKHIKIDDSVIRSHVQKRFLFLSNNDLNIPAPLSIGFGHLLNAQMIEVKQAGQFRDQDGLLEFPQLWEKLKPILTAKEEA